MLSTVLAVIERRYDDEGIELSHLERKDDLLDRLANADDARALDRGRGSCSRVAARCSPISGAPIFPKRCGRASTSGREATIQWYRRVHDRLVEVGFRHPDYPIMEELHDVVRSLEHYAGAEARSG